MCRLTGWIAIFCINSISQSALALESFEYYRGVRGLAMGGAAIAVVNDETSLIINPAGLTKLRDFFGTVIDPEIEYNGLVKQSLLTGNISSFTGGVDQTAELAEANPGDYSYSRTQLFPSLVVRNFGMGALYTKEQYGVYDPDTATLDIMGRTDTTFLVGYSFRFWGGRIKLGLTGKYIQRTIVDELDLDPSVVPKPSSLAKSGTGLGVDTGLILTAPWMFLPTMAVVVRDVGDTKFNIGADSSDTLPDTLNQEVDVGLSLTAIHDPMVRSQWTLEYKNALNPVEGTNPADQLHAGAEVNYGDVIFFRGGMYHKYWTAGGEFSSEYYQLQLATYAKNIGSVEAPVEDRRYVVKVALRF